MATKSTRPALLEKTYKAKMGDEVFYEMANGVTRTGTVYEVGSRHVAVKFPGNSPREDFKLKTRRIFPRGGQLYGSSRFYVAPELTA